MAMWNVQGLNPRPPPGLHWRTLSTKYIHLQKEVYASKESIYLPLVNEPNRGQVIQNNLHDNL